MSKKKPSEGLLKARTPQSMRPPFGLPNLSEVLAQAASIAEARDMGPRNSAGELVDPTLGRKLH